MTRAEIEKKIEQYKLSDAPIEVKEAAIKKLEGVLCSSSVDIAKQQFIEGQSDLDDINN